MLLPRNRFRGCFSGLVPQLAVLLIILSCVAEAANDRVINLRLGRLGRYDEEQVLMADVFFSDVRIPRFVSIPSFYGIALLISAYCRRGFAVSMLSCIFLGFVLFLVYLITLGSVDQDDMSRYGVLNFRPILTNRGALGGPYLAIHFFLLVGFAAGTGGMISGAYIDITTVPRGLGYGGPVRKHSRSMKIVDCSNHCGRGGGRCCDGCAALNDDQFETNEERMQFIGANGVVGEFDTSYLPPPDYPGDEDNGGVMQSFVSTHPGERVSWGVMGDFIGLVAVIGLATGPSGEIWTNPEYYGFVLLGLFVAYLVIYLCYQLYRYQDVIDDPTDCEVVKMRCSWKSKVFFGPLLAIALYYIGMFIYFYLMGFYGAYGIIKFAQDAEEARYFAYQNVLSELVVSLSIAIAILLIALLCYCITLTRTRAGGPVECN